MRKQKVRQTQEHLLYRHAYHEAIARERAQFREWRDDPLCTMRVPLPGLNKTRPVRDLTDSQIESVALAIAERTINELIHKHGDERLLEDC